MTPERGKRRLLVALIALACAGGVAFGAIRLAGGDDGPIGPGAVNLAADAARADYRFAIPAGTGVRLDNGEKLELMPARIVARVGEVIRIVNRDDRGYLLGPFYIGAGETLTQQFTSAGTFIGECIVHPSGTLELEVRE